MKHKQNRLRLADGGELVNRFAARQATVESLRDDSSSFQPMPVEFKNGGSLRMHGSGTVPGKGQGDKVKALYEPGEFIVSNEMLAAAPELRGQLHGLRGQVLAEKGVTPQEADAKAVSGGTLRAQSGGSLYPYQPAKNIYAGALKPGSAPENTPGRGGILGPSQSEGAQNGQAQAAVVGVGPESTGGATGSRGGGPAGADVAGVQRGPVGVAAGGQFLPATRAGLRGTGVAMSQAVDQGKYAKAGGRLVAGTLGLAQNLADDVLGGAARGAHGLLRTPVEDFGRAALGLEDRPEPSTSPQSPRTPQNSLRPGADATLPGLDPNRVSLRGRSGTDVVGAPGVSKFVEDGRTLFSNVAGDNADMMAKNLVGVVPGMSQAQIDATLTNPDGSRWSAQDNAIMAANLRDGIDPYRGTSRQSAQAGREGMTMREALARIPDDTNRLRIATDEANSRRTAQSAGARLRFDELKDERARVDNRSDKALEQGDKAGKQFADQFQAFNPDGSVNPALSAAKQQTMTKLFGGVDLLSPEGRSKHLPEVRTLGKIFDRIATNPQMGFAKINPLDPRGPAADTMPDWRGGKLVRQGLGGLITPGSSVGDYYVQHNGENIPLGADLSENELAAIEHQIKTGSWRGAPTNTQRGN